MHQSTDPPINSSVNRNVALEPNPQTLQLFAACCLAPRLTTPRRTQVEYLERVGQERTQGIARQDVDDPTQEDGSSTGGEQGNAPAGPTTDDGAEKGNMV